MPNQLLLKKKIINEIDKIAPQEYDKVYSLLKMFRSKAAQHQASTDALEQLFSLEGCLQDEEMNSVELQKKVADDWGKNYEIDRR